MNLIRLAALCAAIALVPAVAHGAIIFDNSSVASSAGPKLASGAAPLAIITVSTSTTINQIGVLLDLNGSTSGNSGDLKFVVFDDSTGTRLLVTSAQTFADDGFTFKLSNTFAPFTLLPGTTYDIGAISNQIAAFAEGSPTSDYTQNGITAVHNDNGNALNYSNPTLNANHGTVMVGIELGAAKVPEPETVALLVLGFAAATTARFRRGRSLTGRSRGPASPR